MAQDAVDRITDRPCRTARLPLVGAPGSAPRRPRRGSPAASAPRPPPWPQLGSTEPLAPGVPVCEAELRWAAAHELALTAEDLADRRTRAGLVPEWREAVLAAARATIPAWSSALSPPPTSATSPS